MQHSDGLSLWALIQLAVECSSTAFSDACSVTVVYGKVRNFAKAGWSLFHYHTLVLP